MTEKYANLQPEQPIVWGALEIDVPRRGLAVDGVAIQLTPTEWGVLLALVHGRGAVLMPDELLQRVWGDTFGAGRDYVHVYINRLRRKLEIDPAQPRLIVTEQGGYRLVREPATEERPERTRPELPIELTSFVGREADLAALLQLLRQPDIRLLTLTGPSGAGKTRLALEAGRAGGAEWPDGVYFVPLAALTEPAQVPAAIATALGLAERRSQSTILQIQRFLHNRTCLLLLDNFEHLRPAGAAVLELLQQTTGVTALVTSRARLNVRGEHERVVEPLPLPPADPSREQSAEQLTANPAVALFADRASAVDSRFRLTRDNAATIAAICRKLDGLPLAIELAAARTNVLPMPALLERLDQRLALLRGGPQDLPAHQQTLRGAIDWSYALLSPGAQRLLAQLGVFAGGCTLEALEEILPDVPVPALIDDLTTLIEHHLVRRDVDADGARYRLLETIREYALEQLGHGADALTAQRRHAEYYLRLAGRAGEHLQSAAQLGWLRRLDQEHPNMTAALGWLLAHGRAADAIELSGGLDIFWLLRGRVDEAAQWLTAALEQEPADTPVHAGGLLSLALLEWQQDNLAAALPRFEAALAMYQRLEDEAGIAGALNHSGAALLAAGQRETGLARLEASRAIYRGQGHTLGTACVQSKISVALMNGGELERGLAMAHEALAMLAEVGDRVDSAGLNRGVGGALLNDGQVERALPYLERSRELYAELGTPQRVALVHWMLAQAELSRDRAADAREHLRTALEICLQARSFDLAALVTTRMAAAALRQEQAGEAAWMLGVAAQALAEPDVALRTTAEAEHGATAPLVQAALSTDDWQRAFERGRSGDLRAALSEMAKRAGALGSAGTTH